MVKVGDKVRFLNSVGGGIVVKITKDIALVEEEDGFETPVLVRECVVIESASTLKNDTKKHTETFAYKTPASEMTDESITTEEEPEKLEIIETVEGDRLNIVLAFLPENQKSLQNTRFDTYLINDSNYYVFFSYLINNGYQWKTIYSGSVEPNIQIQVENFGKEDLNEHERICIQYIAFKQDKPFDLKNPASVEHRIDPVKFYKLHSFRENEYFDEDAIVLNIVKNDIPEKQFIPDASKIEKAIRSKKAIDTGEKKPVTKKKHATEGPLEIDLHINELLDSTAGMTNKEILEYQLSKFRETLESYKGEKGKKIVFIHGKGDGILRKAILTELRTKYKHYDYQDASFREYGFGATQITIR
ncbi:DUF2027 domain-containing protein [Coprobacter tertius]|uniref:DUF2027 domain-containing protein n=1 Tax=Coprobacter tertius TaxID=2944915 RepID=A0ABT1MKU0_9BACT|nr:DUF2027 domain-containing protein [Coprobacter tertius]MCP9612323.1 DUF2027 domain-containing protein [Coprobacter tertius]